MTSDDLPLARILPPSIGVGALVTLLHLGMWWAAVVALIVTVGVVFLAFPKQNWNLGLDQKTTEPSDFNRWDHIKIFIPGALSYLVGPSLAYGPEWWPLYFAGMTGVTAWTFRASARRSAVIGRRRVAGALEQTSLEDATVSRLQAADDHRDVVNALLELGAVDGIRARMWRLADALGQEVAETRQSVLALDRVGVVRVSTIDAGADTTRHLVDLSPVGVRVMSELRHR